jgi:LysM repeat protein
MRWTLIIFISLLWNTSWVCAQTSRQEYIDQYKELAIKEMNRTGIPASITLAQGILESANGNSRLATKANNHFGIKCHSNWKGKTIRKDDDAKNECFRKYPSAYDSFIDHSDFLVRGQRYAFLFEYKTTDYKKWAKGLKKAGYATSPTYATRLIQIIEDHQLYQYDNDAYLADKSPVKKVEKPKKERKKIRASKEDYAIQLGRIAKNTNRATYIIAKKGDTYAKLIEEFQMLRWELYKYNDVEKNAKLEKGQRVYLQPKRNKAERSKNKHTVQEGETLWQISQEYGVKLKKLAKRNKLEKNAQLSVGQIIKLR